MVLHHVWSQFTVAEALLLASSRLHWGFAAGGGDFDGRNDWIRTSDLTHPKGALYQAEPRPDVRFSEYISSAEARSSGVQGFSLVRRGAMSFLLSAWPALGMSIAAYSPTGMSHAY